MLRVISDIHGKTNKYLELIKDAEYSVQLGDFGFEYGVLNTVDPDCHKIIPGNHDNIDDLLKWPHCLGDYGFTTLGGISFFFVRGEFSIDWKQRVIMEAAKHTSKIWWENEQLSFKQMYECLELYRRVKPDVVITHGAPRSIANKIGNSAVLRRFGYNPETFTTNTSDLLQAMIESYSPKTFYCGHYHIDKTIESNGTKFKVIKAEGFRDVVYT